MTKHYIKILTNSHAGTVARLLSLFSSRGISIDTINSGDEVGTTYSRVVLGIQAKKEQLKIICHQIERLYDTISVTLYEEDALEVETLILKIKGNQEVLQKIQPILGEQTVECVSCDGENIILGKIGTAPQLEAAKDALKGYEVIEMIHTGATVISK